MKLSSLLLAALMGISILAQAEELKLDDQAPLFKAKNHEGKEFDLSSRKGLWTVLYFYPRSGTSGCTKQARGFQSQLKKIRVQGADVFGVSMNTVPEQAAFHKDEQLRFTLLADPEAKIVDLFGARLFPAPQSKRWTFIIDPDLRIKDIEKDVDPMQNPEFVLTRLLELKAQKSDQKRQEALLKQKAKEIPQKTEPPQTEIPKNDPPKPGVGEEPKVESEKAEPQNSEPETALSGT